MEIDDLLCEGVTMEKLLTTLRKVLTRCREKNIKLARHKLEFGKEIDFAGQKPKAWVLTVTTPAGITCPYRTDWVPSTTGTPYS